MSPHARNRGPDAASRKPRSPQARQSTAAPESSERHLNVYEPAIRITVVHEYYTVADGAAWFRIVTARDSLEGLRDRGFLVRMQREELVILRNAGRRRHVQRPEGHIDWLAFLIYGADQEFACVSDGVIESGRPTECLYFSNRETGGATEPGSERRMLNGERVPLLPKTFSVSASPGEPIEILDWDGQPVTSLRAPGGSPGTASADGVLSYDPVARQVRVDLSGLPAGRYTVRVGGRQASDGLRLPANRVPAAFLELAVALVGDCEDDAIVFKARRTFWKYTVVSRPGSGPLDRLSILTAVNGSASREESIPAFLGPFEETLPNGVRAHQFLSAAPIALASRSEVRLRLTGRRKERMTRESVLVDCLPVPAKHQLALLTDHDLERLGTDERLCSEMFVYV